MSANVILEKDLKKHKKGLICVNRSFQDIGTREPTPIPHPMQAKMWDLKYSKSSTCTLAINTRVLSEC